MGKSDLSAFQSTPSVGRATDTLNVQSRFEGIPIHALRGEGDKVEQVTEIKVDWISIHALRGEGDDDGQLAHFGIKTFQSTPSVGRATRGNNGFGSSGRYFNPRPPWGGRREAFAVFGDFVAISIHALRGEGDLHGQEKYDKAAISIHALRGEGDMFEPVAWVWDLDFNPRPPWGGRRAVVQDFHIPASYFNPRPPWGGRPETQGKRRAIIGDFNPRPPWGGQRCGY